MAHKLIFVTGYFGAPILEEARSIAECKGWEVLDLDARIEESDGRSIARLCMMGGEHAYRNAEFEEVERLCEAAKAGAAQTEANESAAGRVIACGDGILYVCAGVPSGTQPRQDQQTTQTQPEKTE